ncbi:hypothetical protein R1flu_018941 [Riccia fluitans]|uniref:Uncharacterized protein n=1 Tax=Riccia fluitans TaxID=41844 RepID=A0ABD1ZHA5_9MARC
MLKVRFFLPRFDNAQGLMRFAYYCSRNFFIRAAQELRDVNVEDFKIESLRTGLVLRYVPGTCKNRKVNVKHCGANTLRKPVDCPVADVITFIIKMTEKRPVFGTNQPGPHPLFLTLNHKYEVTDLIWYSKMPVGKNTLREYSKKMAADIPELKGFWITNKVIER